MIRKIYAMVLIVMVFCGTHAMAENEGFEFPNSAIREEIHAAVIEVSWDCTWVIAGERLIYVGPYIMGGAMKKTVIGGVSSQSRGLWACAFKEGDDVIIRGVLIEEGVMFALSIRKK